MNVFASFVLILLALVQGHAEAAGSGSTGELTPPGLSREQPGVVPSWTVVRATVRAGRGLLQKSSVSCGPGYASTCQVGVGQICQAHAPGCRSTGVQLFGKQCCCCPTGGAPAAQCLDLD